MKQAAQKNPQEAPMSIRMSEDDRALLERVRKAVDRGRVNPVANSKLFKLGLRALAEKYGVEPGL